MKRTIRYFFLDVVCVMSILDPADAEWSNTGKGGENHISKQSVWNGADKQSTATPVQTFVVSDPGDAPADTVPVFYPPTLRAAIQCANYAGDLDMITMSIESLKVLSALPNISAPVFIDGSVTGGSFILDGSALPQPPPGVSYVGLAIIGGASTLQMMEIRNFPSGGILLQGDNNLIAQCRIHHNGGPGVNLNSADNNTIRSNIIYGHSGDAGSGISIILNSEHTTIDSNRIGTADGYSRAANSRYGIYLETGMNLIRANLISGNDWDGIHLASSGGDISQRNVVERNLIGTTGGILDTLPNGDNGVNLAKSIDDTIRFNTISGNKKNGVSISSTSSGQLINRNYIGTNLFSELRFGNGYSGIGSSGSSVTIADNVISGNSSAGVSVFQNVCRITRNNIGTGYLGTSAVRNLFGGVVLYGAGSLVDSNTISGNGEAGVQLRGLSATGNIVRGNYIGTDVAGTSAVPNGHGVEIAQFAHGNTVSGNLISGNTGDGVRFTHPFNQSPSGNFIRGNYIGLAVNGTAALANRGNGVSIDSSGNNVIGGNRNNGEGNVISGNWQDGIMIVKSGASGNVVSGNTIGAVAGGSSPLGNYLSGITISSPGNFVGGRNAGEENVISGNAYDGIDILDSLAAGNTILNNRIGVDLAGNAGLGNWGHGVWIYRAPANTIGDTSGAARNIISGNLQNGVLIQGLPAAGNLIVGNYIGTNAAATSALGNGQNGIVIKDAPRNTIGGSAPGSGNVVSGNGYNGILIRDSSARYNVVDDNLLGTNAAGDAAIPNLFHGIQILSASQNRVADSVGNVISGNLSVGVYIDRSESTLVRKNIIGLNSGGTQILGNRYSGVYLNHADRNFIGDTAAGSGGNVVSGNAGDGIWIDEGSDENLIGRNIVGLDPAGLTVLGNGYAGIVVTGMGTGAPSVDNRISKNSVFGNGYLGIDLGGGGIVTPNEHLDADDGDNELQNYPELTLATVDSELTVWARLRSKPLKVYHLEFYASDSCDASGFGEGKTFLGSSARTTDALGEDEFSAVFPVTFPAGFVVTATATDGFGNTSEFSRCAPILPPGMYADVAIEISDALDTTSVGDTARYALKVKNHGPSIVTNVTVTDTLPRQVSYLSDSTTRGTTSLINNILTCAIDTLAVGDTAVITIVCRLDSLGMVKNEASLTADQLDSYPQNNRAEDRTVVTPTTSVDEGPSAAIPTAFVLHQNYPNPFNPATTIRYGLPRASYVTLKVYDVLGQEVATLVDALQGPGYKSITWDAGVSSSGVYFYRLRARPIDGGQTGAFAATKKLLMLK